MQRTKLVAAAIRLTDVDASQRAMLSETMDGP